MAPHGDTRSGDPRRKTLEDIRREVDAEYPGLLDEDREDEDWAAPRSRRRARHVLGYLAAAAIGCVVGQALLVGYVAVTRYTRHVATAPAVADRSAPAVPRSNAEGTAAPTPPGVSELPPTLPPSEAGHDVATNRSEPAPPSAPAMAGSTRAATTEMFLKVLAHRLMPWLPTDTPPASTLVEPNEPLSSEAQLRSALVEWLRTSKHRDPRAAAADAEVIFGADGQTATTRFHDRSESADVVRELRWARGPHGWTIAGEAGRAVR